MALQRITDAGDPSLILILSDINMPGMSSLELLTKAKAMRPDVPIILIADVFDGLGDRFEGADTGHFLAVPRCKSTTGPADPWT
jgi:CheY-like chemotaxis protein